MRLFWAGIAFIVYGFITYCDNSHAQVSAGTKLSQENNNNAFTLGDFHSFDLNGPDNWGLERYGTGRGELELYQNGHIGLMGDNRSGILWGNEGNGLKLGLEPMAGSLAYHDKPLYQWEPGLSLGVKLLGFYAGPRMGLSYNNTGNDTFTGMTLQMQVFKVNFSYWENDYTNKIPKLQIYNINVFDKVSIEERMQNNDKITMIGMRF